MAIANSELQQKFDSKRMKDKGQFTNLTLFFMFVLILLLIGALDTQFLNAEILPDEYEIDNSYDQSKVIVLNYHDPQPHTFHQTDDEDWVKFYALKDETYKIKAANPQTLICDPIIELYEPDGTTRIAIKNDGGPGVEESLTWTCSLPSCEGGIYYVRMTNAVSYWGANVWYDLSVDIPGAFTLPGYVTGKIFSGGRELGGAALQAGSGTGLSQQNGAYIISTESGPHTVTVSKSGYHSASFSVTVPGGGSVSRNVELVRIDNKAPLISGRTDITVSVNIPFNLVLVASDPDGDAISFSIEGKPSWIDFDTTTGTLSGIPKEEHIGQHGPITITVTDYFGASSKLAPFNIKVTNSLSFLPAILHILSKK